MKRYDEKGQRVIEHEGSTYVLHTQHVLDTIDRQGACNLSEIYSDIKDNMMKRIRMMAVAEDYRYHHMDMFGRDVSVHLLTDGCNLNALYHMQYAYDFDVQVEIMRIQNIKLIYDVVTKHWRKMRYFGALTMHYGFSFGRTHLIMLDVTCRYDAQIQQFISDLRRCYRNNEYKVIYY